MGAEVRLHSVCENVERHTSVPIPMHTSHGHECDIFTFSPNANGVGADAGESLIARTPLAWRLNLLSEAVWSITFVPLDQEKRNTMSVVLTEQQRYTPDDLLALPDAERFELVDGQLVERAMGFKSSRIGNRVSYLLTAHSDQHQLGWVLGSDTGYRCFSDDRDKVRKPDVSFVAASRLKADEEPEGFATLAPDLAVEVISPTELFEDVMVKVSEYLDAGVKLVWVIDPATQRVHIYRPDGGTILTAKDQLDGETVLPGFRCAIADLFVPPAGTA